MISTNPIITVGILENNIFRSRNGDIALLQPKQLALIIQMALSEVEDEHFSIVMPPGHSRF